LLKQLVTSLLSSTTLYVARCHQAVDNLLTSWEQAVRTHPVDKLLISCWNSIATSLLQVCYNLFVFMCVIQIQHVFTYLLHYQYWYMSMRYHFKTSAFQVLIVGCSIQLCLRLWGHYFPQIFGSKYTRGLFAVNSNDPMLLTLGIVHNMFILFICLQSYTRAYTRALQLLN
jgi:hypothetical protein